MIKAMVDKYCSKCPEKFMLGVVEACGLVHYRYNTRYSHLSLLRDYNFEIPNICPYHLEFTLENIPLYIEGGK